MTFLTHHDTDSLLLAVGDWSDETGCMMADRPTAPSAGDSSREAVAKKKISLKDYKTQKTSGAVASPMGLEASSRGASNSTKSEERPHTTTSDLAKNTEGIKLPRMPPKPHPNLSSEKPGLKRPSGSELEFNSSGSKKPEAYPTKKPRLSPEKEIRRDSSPSKSHTPKLPALLSPTLPPTSGGPRLPRLLSPTLPPDIEKELARLEDRSPSRNSRAEKALPARDPSTHEHLKEHSHANLQRAQLITKLRYGRANRKRVEALLKFSGKRKAHRSDSPISQDTDRDDVSNPRKKSEDDGSSRVNPSLAELKSKKHENDGSLGAQGYRSKEPKGVPDKPRTPVHQPPLTSHSITHDKIKVTADTPMKDLKPPSSRRTDIGEVDSKAPYPANKRHSVDPGSVTKASPTQADGRTRNERQIWWDEWQRFATIGRELKHAAERHTSRNGTSATDEKLAVVTAIEALLSFIMAFVANDQAKALSRQVGDSSTWLSIVPYWRVVKKNSVPYPALNSLCLLLGAVSFTAIHTLDLERLAISPIPGEHTPVPTPGSDGNAAVSDENRKSRKEFSELKTRLPEFYKDSQRLWLEGIRGLSEDVLGREFPTIWSQRSRNYSERGRSTLKAGDYAGSYFLPLGGTTPPIEVVRFGWSLLKEWCSKERVDWTGRLGL
jgi:hypothetical protein